MNNVYKKILLSILSIIFISCATYQNKIDLSMDIPLPDNDSWESIDIKISGDPNIPEDWWKVFGGTKIPSPAATG